MSKQSDRWLPAFPLGMVLFPGVLVPLHVFEPRYRALTARCLTESIPFGMFLVRGQAVADIGCEAAVHQVLRTHPDGRSDILVRGGRRLSMKDAREHADGYLEALVEPVEDAAEEPDPEAFRSLLGLLQDLERMEAQGQDLPDVPGGGPLADASAAIAATPGYTYAIAARLRMDMDDRQTLLETLSEHEREGLLLRTLAQLLPQARQGIASRRVVRGNGKPAAAS